MGGGQLGLDVDTLPPLHLRQKALSQWDTPAWLAELMVELAGAALDDASRRAYSLRVLEPSAGLGRLIAPVRARCPGARITAYELDPMRVAHLETMRVADRVIEGDFLASEPDAHYHIAITNPPYEDGADGRFVERCMAVSDRVIALLRTNALHGSERFERVWSQVDRGPWRLRALRYLRSRPQFDGGDGSPMSDFVCVDLERDRFGETDVRWW